MKMNNEKRLCLITITTDYFINFCFSVMNVMEMVWCYRWTSLKLRQAWQTNGAHSIYLCTITPSICTWANMGAQAHGRSTDSDSQPVTDRLVREWSQMKGTNHTHTGTGRGTYIRMHNTLNTTFDVWGALWAEKYFITMYRQVIGTTYRILSHVEIPVGTHRVHGTHYMVSIYKTIYTLGHSHRNRNMTEAKHVFGRRTLTASWMDEVDLGQPGN